LGASLFYFIEQHADLVLVPREPVYCVGHNHVHSTLPEQEPQPFDARPI
jgi:hypothetical protein